MNSTQSQPILASDLIPLTTLLVITIGWAIIFLNLLKVYKLIIRTNIFLRHFIRLIMSNVKKIKLESRTLLERRDCDYIVDPFKLLQFSYSCLIPKTFHNLPHPNLNFKLVWCCECGYQPDPNDNEKTCMCQEVSIKIDLIDSVRLVRETPVIPSKNLSWHTPQDLPFDLRKQ